MLGSRLGIRTALVAMLMIVAIAVPAGAAGSAPSTGSHGRTHIGSGHPGSPAWLAALAVRSEALNARYGLGAQTIRPAGLGATGWLAGLMARSDALNRLYGLGKYAR
jgi:hypothetical protein